MARKSKNLIEAASDVLHGIETLTEVSNPDPVDSSATLTTGNAKTLHPGSGPSMPRPTKFVTPGAPADTFSDLGGATPHKVADGNLGARAAGGNKHDTSIKTSTGSQG